MPDDTGPIDPILDAPRRSALNFARRVADDLRAAEAARRAAARFAALSGASVDEVALATGLATDEVAELVAQGTADPDPVRADAEAAVRTAGARWRLDTDRLMRAVLAASNAGVPTDAIEAAAGVSLDRLRHLAG